MAEYKRGIYFRRVCELPKAVMLPATAFPHELLDGCCGRVGFVGVEHLNRYVVRQRGIEYQVLLFLVGKDTGWHRITVVHGDSAKVFANFGIERAPALEFVVLPPDIVHCRPTTGNDNEMQTPLCLVLVPKSPAEKDCSARWKGEIEEMDEKGLTDAAMAALEAALEARLARRGDMVLTDASLLSLVREARDPEAARAFDRPAPVLQLPGPPPEFPKLKVKYIAGRPVEHVVCETIYEEVPYMSGGWYTRPMSELEEVRRMIE
jgi:hypothetical protein